MKNLLFKIFLAIALLFSLSNSCWAQELSGPFQAGVNEYRSGHYKKASSIMEKLVQIEPENYYAHYYLAISLVKLKDLDKARKHYQIVIDNSDDSKIISYSQTGIEKLDEDNKVENVEIIEADKPEESQITVDTAEQINDYSDNIDNSINNNTNVQVKPNQNAMINEIAAKNNINPVELNNLIRLLANNPSAMQTLNKLASTKQGGNNAVNNMDPKSIAKLVKMFTLNSQMGLLNSMNQTDDDSKKNNGSNDMFSMLMGQNNPMMNMKNMQAMQGAGGNGGNDMQVLMNYMGGSGNQNNFDPNMVNQLFNNNMMNGADSGF